MLAMLAGLPGIPSAAFALTGSSQSSVRSWEGKTKGHARAKRSKDRGALRRKAALHAHPVPGYAKDKGKDKDKKIKESK
jgi:hypothetical protein